MAEESPYRKKYGKLFPLGATDLEIELWGYREGWLESGHDREYHFVKAFRLMWPKFRWHEWVELMVSAFCRYELVTVIGHTRASKTFTMAHVMYLDFHAAPFHTSTSLATTTFDGLKTRMWADLNTAMASGVVANPFRVRSTENLMRVEVPDDPGLSREGNNARRDRYNIHGLAVAVQKDAAGRIQGRHAPRRRIVLDEAQELPDSIWTAEANARSAGEGYRGVRLANPHARGSRFGRMCEPKGGWGSISDRDLFWETAEGGACLHLDGLQCHNAKLWVRLEAGEITLEDYEKQKLPFQPEMKYFETLRGSPLEWWKYVRGYWPPDGLVNVVFTDGDLGRMKEEDVFMMPPKAFALLDTAYEWDECVLVFGEYGEVAGGRVRAQFTGGVNVLGIVGSLGLADCTEATPKDYRIARAVKRLCQERGVVPARFAMDKTGNGRSVHAILTEEWGEHVGVDFAGAPSDEPLRPGMEDKAKDLYAYRVDEIWFRTAEYAKHGQVGGLRRLDAKAEEDLSTRLYELQGHKKRVEPKDKLKKRLGRSCDWGDAVCLLGTLLSRLGIHPGGGRGGVSPSVRAATQMDRAKRAAALYGEEFSRYHEAVEARAA